MVVRVYPGAKNPTHEISLSDGVTIWGLRLDGGPEALKESPVTPTLMQFKEGESKFGDWEPGMSHIQQRTWEGGRGMEEFVDDPTRFFDSMMAWTMTPGRLLPAPQWKFAQGIRESYELIPGDVSWQALLDDKHYLSIDFTIGGSDLDVQKAYLWIRRKGSPGVLNLAIYTDSGGSPDSEIMNSSSALTINVITDMVSEWYGFDISEMVNLSASTKYHLVVFGAENDNAANHWELGVDKTGSSSKGSSDGSSWSAAEFSLYHRVVAADIDRKWQVFEFRGAMYAVDARADGTASSLFINGDRGNGTGGSSTTLQDTDKSWTADEWIGAWGKIIDGTGKGQYRQITGNGTNTLTVASWQVNLNSASVYVIYSTDKWTDISPTVGDLIDGVVTSVGIINDQVLFAQGTGVNILKMRYNKSASPPAHEFDDDGTNKANLLHIFVDEINGVQVWRALNNTVIVDRAAPTSWGAALNFGSDISVGDDSLTITNLYDHDGKLYAFKLDGRYYIDPEGKAAKQIGKVGFPRSENNGEAVLSHGLETYFSWGGYALYRVHDSSGSYDLSILGPDRDAGLPDGRRGKIVHLVGHPIGLFAAVDAGENRISSVLLFDPVRLSWHEVFRGWEVGKRVQTTAWQDCPGTRPRLWISVGGELVFQEWPQETSNPLRDDGLNYQHESVLVMGSIDMGAARLPKFIKEMALISENLTTGVEVHLDYQVDNSIGGNTWNKAETFYSSPEDTLPLNEGNVRKIRMRLRMITEYADVPPVAVATVLEGFARTPLKFQWDMRVKVGSTQRDLAGVNADHDPDEFLIWLKDAAIRARKVYMRSIWSQMDGKYVIVEPPSLLRQFTNNILGFWGGSVTVTVREA